MFYRYKANLKVRFYSSHRHVLIIAMVHVIVYLKGQEPSWANPELNVGNYLKKLKNGLKIIHCTLPSCLNFQKSEFSTAHEMNFKHSFKIRRAKSTFVG